MDIPYEMLKWVAMAAVIGAALTVVWLLWPDLAARLGSVSGLWG